MIKFRSQTDKESDPIFSRNPFMLNGEEWKEKRAEITPAFTISKVRPFFDNAIMDFFYHFSLGFID